MATTTARRPAGVKADTLVEQSIATAAGKVRVNDLATGGAMAAVLALGYVVLMMILDKSFILPGWVRQLSFGGFLIALASVVYFAIVVPFRRRVNPRFIARQVERTIPDAKNVLINYVDLQDEELPASVKASVAAKAADELAGADVDTATNSKRVMWLTITAGVLVAALAVLFLVFKWPQFSSLVSRAVNPFANTVIASRTRIDLLDPTGGHATVTDGEQLNVAISIGGAIPDSNGPDKPRLLVKHNPDAIEYDEFPLIRGESSREFALMVPRSIIQNGFWYKVAAGDAVTDEYRVDVRTRPMLKGFEVKYEYPAYLKWPADFGADARLRGMRGTAVTLTIQTNRTVESGSLVVSAGRQNEAIRGEVTGVNHDSIRFKLKLVESGLYSVQLKPANGEAAFTSIQYPIDVEIDQAPKVTITTPKEDEAVVPATSLLAVDATLNDDHGITAAALRFKLVGRDSVAVAAKKYRDGKSLAREKDGTFETEIKDYKDSIALDKLTDEKGQPLTLKEGDVLEYWVEATDNCTEPRANVGESAHKKVRIAPPPPKPDPKQQQRNDQRKQDEKNAQQKQDERQKNDTRPQDQARNQDPNKQPEQPKDGDKQEGGQPGDPKNDPQQPKNDGQKGGDPKQQAGSKQEGDPMNKEGGQKEGDPMSKGGQNDPNQGGNPNENKGSDSKQSEGSGGKPNDPELQKQADKLNEKLDQKNSEPGDGKGDGSSAPKGSETKPTQQTKPNDPMNKGGSEGAVESKGGETGENKAGDQKGEGKVAPPEQSTEKTPPKDDGKGDQKPTGEQKAGPKDGADKGGETKGSPPEASTQPNDPANNGGEKSGEAGTAKGAQPPQPGEQERKEIEDAVRELDHENPGTREAAKQKLDKKLGKQNRETVERLNRDLKSGDPQKQEQAKQEIDELAKKAKPPEQQPGGESGQPDKSDAKNPDEMSGAKENGEPNRGQPKGPGGAASKETRPDDDSKGAGEAKGEKPGDPASSKEGEKKSGSGAGTDQKGPPQDATGEKPPPKAGPNDPMNPMNKEGEPGESKGEGAKPSNPMGTDGGDNKATTKSSDQKAGTGKPDDKTKPDNTKPTAGGNDQKDPKNEKGGQGGNDQKLDPKEMEKAVRDLDSENPGAKAAAQEKLDKAIGKQNREKVEQLNRDLKSDDKQKQENAKKEIEELAKKAGQQPQQPKELTEQEKKDIADAAKNLNSNDETDRKAAEQKIDQMIGKDKREEFQKDLKDLQGDDPQKAQQAREKLEKMAEAAKNQQPGKTTDDLNKRGGPANYDKAGKPIEDNPENRWKTADLNLKKFKELRENPEFLKESGYTPEQYDKFLRGYEDMVNRTRETLDRERLNPTPEQPLGAAQIKNDAGGDRVKGRTEGAAVGGSGGVSVAPTGFSEAQRRFAEAAAKRAAENEKK